MFFWNAIPWLRVTFLSSSEGQCSRQRYFCVQHACRYAAFRPFGARGSYRCWRSRKQRCTTGYAPATDFKSDEFPQKDHNDLKYIIECSWRTVQPPTLQPYRNRSHWCQGNNTCSCTQRVSGSPLAAQESPLGCVLSFSKSKQRKKAGLSIVSLKGSPTLHRMGIAGLFARGIAGFRSCHERAPPFFTCLSQVWLPLKPASSLSWG